MISTGTGNHLKAIAMKKAMIPPNDPELHKANNNQCRQTVAYHCRYTHREKYLFLLILVLLWSINSYSQPQSVRIDNSNNYVLEFGAEFDSETCVSDYHFSFILDSSNIINARCSGFVFTTARAYSCPIGGTSVCSSWMPYKSIAQTRKDKSSSPSRPAQKFSS